MKLPTLLVAILLCVSLYLSVKIKYDKECKQEAVELRKFKAKHLHYSAKTKKLRDSYFHWSRKIKPFPKPIRDIDDYIADLKPFLQ